MDRTQPLFLFDLLTTVVINRWKLLGFSLAIAFVVGYTATFLIPRVYESELTLIVSIDDSAVPSLGGNLAALAGLAGTIGTQKQREAIALLTAKEIAVQFVKEHSLTSELFPIRWWWNDQTWGLDGPPSETQIAEAFRQSMLKIHVDPDTSLVLVSVAAPTPTAAVDRVEKYVAMVDNKLRDRAIRETSDTLETLERELAKATTVELRNAISSLMETTVKEKTFAGIRQQYAYRTVDGPLLMDVSEPARPKRLFFAIATSLCVFTITIFACAWPLSHRMATMEPS